MGVVDLFGFKGQSYNNFQYYKIIQMLLFLTKVTFSILIVIGLVFVSEKSPRAGGLLAGLPLGTGLMIFFYGVEQGETFVIHSIPYGIAGLVSMQSFCVGFYQGGKLFLKNGLLHSLSGFIFGSIAFLCMSSILNIFEINLIESILIFIGGLTFTALYFKNISVVHKKISSQFTIHMLLFRVVFVTCVVLGVTGFAEKVGVQWSGILASFPTTLCPVLMILAYKYKNDVYPVLLKHFSYSITSLAVFYLLVFILFPAVSVFYGSLLAYIFCFMYLYILSKFKSPILVFLTNKLTT